MVSQRKSVRFIWVAVILLIWVGFLGLQRNTINTHARTRIQNEAVLAQQDWEATLQSRIEQVRTVAGALQPGAEQWSAEDVLQVLATLPAGSSGAHWLLMNGTGGLLGEGSAAYLQPAGIGIMQLLARQDSVAWLLQDMQNQPHLAVAVSLAGLPGYYLVWVDAQDALVNDWLNTVERHQGTVGIMGNNNQLLFTASDARADSVAEQAALMDTLQQPQQTDGDLRLQSYKSQYCVVLPLQQPAGLWFGVCAQQQQLVPMSGAVYTSVLVMLFLFSLLMGGVLFYFWRRLKKDAHRKGIDPLTGLFSVASLRSLYTREWRRNLDRQQNLVCFDIVSFKRFNLMFGYSKGDLLLETIGRILRQNYSRACRINGDTFLVLTLDDPDPTATIRGLLLDGLRDEFGDRYLQLVAFRFGIYPVTSPEDGSFQDVYDAVQFALVSAKRSPDSEAVVYGPETRARSVFQKNIEMNMLYALSNEEFLVYIQPKYQLKHKCFIGGEALVRWKSDRLGYIYPDQFIPLFEKNGFILEVDFYMLTHVFDLLRDTLDKGFAPQPISVNQSRVTITFPEYMERLRKLVRRYPDVPTHLVEIEITESALEGDFQQVTQLISELKSMGFSVAMDDFGCGYSSLNALRMLQVDVIKIDKFFLEESEVSPRSRIIIRNIIHMIKQLDIEIVCEGVETASQMMFLEELGCDYAQGYLFAKPLPEEAYAERYMSETDEIKASAQQ